MSHLLDAPNENRPYTSLWKYLFTGEGKYFNNHV